jgi:hypothetical protein
MNNHGYLPAGTLCAGTGFAVVQAVKTWSHQYGVVAAVTRQWRSGCSVARRLLWV